MSIRIIVDVNSNDFGYASRFSWVSCESSVESRVQLELSTLKLSILAKDVSGNGLSMRGWIVGFGIF